MFVVHLATRPGRTHAIYRRIIQIRTKENNFIYLIRRRNIILSVNIKKRLFVPSIIN